ncbi:MAG TPA: BT4734/BF3469 family protein [Rariglobus sp.]|jgi:hypothetical protein|nr:BT4734/BF3469 family protein [Rariglobus sp.]
MISRVPSATSTACTDITVEAAIAEITGDLHAAAILAIRDAVDLGLDDQAATLKRKLPGLLWCGQFARRAAAGLQSRSGLIVADLDDIDDPRGLREIMVFDDHVFAAFISPSGKGLKVVFRCSAEADHAACFLSMEAHLRARYGMTPDPSGKDVSRLCFVSHDPDAHHNAEAAPLPLVDAPAPAPVTAEPPARVAPVEADIKPGDDFNQRGAPQIPDTLRSAGWTQVGSSENWTRPGKKSGVSATWNHGDCEALKVFTSNAPPFEAGKAYGPFQVLSLLRHNGDFAACARELRGLGYGTQRQRLSAAWEPPGIEGLGPVETPSAEPGTEAVPHRETEEEHVLRLVNEREFNPDLPPPPSRPIFMLGGVVISTPGNLTAITAQAKVGKSALVSSLTAAAMTPPDSDADCLTAQAFNQHGHAMIYFDTEQSPFDFWQAINRAHRRAKVPVAQKPGWLRAYSIAGFPVRRMRMALRLKIEEASMECEGVFAVIIDGVADYVADVNDSAECNDFVAELHDLAIRHDCAIICVIHKNPGSEKVRGHLGSQIERKAESNLNLEKDGEVTVISSSKQRGAPINKDTGPRFQWDDVQKMHVSVAVGEAMTKATKKLVDLIQLAEAVLQPGQTMTWREVIAALTEARRSPAGAPTQRTIERWLSSMIAADVVQTSGGKYYLNSKLNLAAS